MKVGLLVSPQPSLGATLHLLTGLPVSMSLHLLLIWMSVASLNLWLLDFHTVQFADSSGCYLF